MSLPPLLLYCSSATQCCTRGRYPARGAESITFYAGPCANNGGGAIQQPSFDSLSWIARHSPALALISDILLQGQANRAIEVLRAMFLGALTFWAVNGCSRYGSYLSCFLILKGVCILIGLAKPWLFIAERRNKNS